MPNIYGQFYHRQRHLRYVTDDPEFKELANELPDWNCDDSGVVSQYQEVCDSFLLVCEELILYKKQGTLDYEQIKVGVVEANSNGTVFVTVSKDAKLKDLTSSWDEIVDARKSVGAFPEIDRGTYNPGLVYAMFRARSKGLTFKKIYDLYQSKNLPLYNGSNKSYDNEDSLQAFYDKYKPTT
jgi:hypothetical protein